MDQISDDRTEAVSLETTSLLGTVRLAQELVRAGRAVDLGGLEDAVGRVCAQALDLPPEGGRAVLEKLEDLQRGLNSLARALEAAL